MSWFFPTSVTGIINRTGDYAIDVGLSGQDVTFSFADNESFSYYFILQDTYTSDYLLINYESCTSKIWKITEPTFNFKSTNTYRDYKVRFCVVSFPNYCDSIEFLSKSDDLAFNYSIKKYEINKNYCSVYLAPLDVRLNISTSSDDYDFNYSCYQPTFQYKVINYTSDFLYFSPTLYILFRSKSPDTVATIKISQTLYAAPYSAYDNDKLGYLCNQSVSFKSQPKYKKFGIQKLLIGRNQTKLDFYKGQYVVFTDFRNISGEARTSEASLEILGNTQYSAIYFAHTGSITLESSSDEPIPCNFVVFNLNYNDCTSIITNVRSNYKFTSQNTANTCVVTAFTNGTVDFDGNYIYDVYGTYKENSNHIKEPFVAKFNSKRDNKFVYHAGDKYRTSYLIKGKNSTHRSLIIFDNSYHEIDSSEPVEQKSDDDDHHNYSGDNSGESLSEGAVLGIIIGAAAGAGLIAIAAYLCYRHRKFRAENPINQSLVDKTEKGDLPLEETNINPYPNDYKAPAYNPKQEQSNTYFENPYE